LWISCYLGEMMFFEVNLIAVTSGIWEWQVCCERKAIVCGYAATRQLAQLGGHIDLFVLLAEQSRLGSVTTQNHDGGTVRCTPHADEKAAVVPQTDNNGSHTLDRRSSPPSVGLSPGHTAGIEMPKFTVYFACQHCERLYTAVQEHQPGAGSFDCRACGTLVHEWSGPYNLIGWKPAELNRHQRL
jgi:hypothetical protein